MCMNANLYFHSWMVADAVSRVLENSEEMNSWRRSLLAACMKGLIAMYNNNKEESKQEVERSMLLRLEELLVRLLMSIASIQNCDCVDLCYNAFVFVSWVLFFVSEIMASMGFY